MAETKPHETAKSGTSINTMDRADYDKAAAEKAKADKEAADRALKEPAAPPTPTQEEADAMKQVALGDVPLGGTLPASSKREIKAENADATYKTR